MSDEKPKVVSLRTRSSYIPPTDPFKLVTEEIDANSLESLELAKRDVDAGKLTNLLVIGYDPTEERWIRYFSGAAPERGSMFFLSLAGYLTLCRADIEDLAIECDLEKFGDGIDGESA